MIVHFSIQSLWLGTFKRFRTQENHDLKARQIFSSQASFFVKTAVDMGGLLIKLGQHISARVDILPVEFTKELSKLQDNVAPVQFEAIKSVIERELGKPIDVIFNEFVTTPIASASLGQVYLAKLPNGDKAAVKVLRPGIENTIQIDLKALQVAVYILKRFTKASNFIDLDMAYNEFKDTILDELNLKKEGKNAEEFTRLFAARKDVVIPKIHWDFSTKKILTMDFVEGVKINNISQLQKWGVDLHKLAVVFFEIYIQQILENGFFHADPHPGNVLVQADGKVVLLDFGMVGRIPPDMKKNLLAMLMAVYLKDTEGAIEVLGKLKFLRRNTNLEVLKQSLKPIFELILGETDEMNFFDSQNNIDELRDFIYTQPFQIPANTMFLGKAVGTVYGICRGLDENFDFYRNAKPYIQKFVLKDLGSYTNVVIGYGKKAAKGIIPTTKKIVSVVDKLDNGNLRLNLSMTFEKKLIETQNRNTNRIIYMMFGGILFISGVMLYQGGDIKISYMLGGMGFLTMLIQLIRFRF